MRSIFFGARKSASHRPEFRLVQLTPVGVTSRQDYGHHAARGGDLCSLALQQAMKAFKLQMCLGQWGMEAPRHPWSPMKMMNMMNMMKTDEKWSNMVKWCMCRWSKSRSLTHGEKARERVRVRARPILHDFLGWYAYYAPVDGVPILKKCIGEMGLPFCRSQPNGGNMAPRASGLCTSQPQRSGLAPDLLIGLMGNQEKSRNMSEFYIKIYIHI